MLEKELNIDKVKLIKCGGNSVIDASREQWNEGSNTLCISPGEVIVYFPYSYSVAGQVVIISAKKVTKLDISATDAMKLVVSGGVSGLEGKNPKALRKPEL